ncbi:MAG: hypothetical protein AAFS10_23400, partial [Myxococcota bacterium]
MSDLLETLKADAKALFVPRSPLSRIGQNLCFAVAFFSLVLLYTTLAYQEDNTLYPRWGELWEGLQTLIYNPDMEESMLWDDSLASFQRLVPAIGLSAVIGVTLGLYMGLYVAAESLFARILEFIGNVPPVAMMVVFLLQFGFDLEMFVAVQVFGIITLVTTGIY